MAKRSLERLSVKDASSGAEGGEMFFGVANHDGGMENGLVLSDGSADGEIDVTIGIVRLSSSLEGSISKKVMRMAKMKENIKFLPQEIPI